MLGVRNVRLLMVGSFLLFWGGKVAVEELGKLKEATRLAEFRSSTAEGTIYSAQKALSGKTAKTTHVDVRYEFLVESGEGSEVSIAATSERSAKALQEMFMRGGKAELPQPEDENENLPKAPDGMSYFSGKQMLSPADYEKLAIRKTARVAYDPNDPSNSMLIGTSPRSNSKLYLLAPFFLILGTALVVVGVSGFARGRGTIAAS